MSDGYRGVLGAFPYAYRRSDSWLFRSYVVVSALAAAAVGLLFASGIVVLIAQTAAVRGGTLTLSRAFFVVVGLLIVLPIVTPTLLVARRHRRERAVGRAYDPLLAGAGYVFLASLYVGLVVTVPGDQQVEPTGALAPVVRLLYDLPQVAGVVPPLSAAVLILVVHRLLRR